MTQQYQIKKGDKFLCIEDYTMDDDTIAYSKGKIYQSHNDSCITDNDDLFYHDMSKQEDFFTHFHKIETEKYILETEHLKTIESWKEEEKIWIKQLAEKDAEIERLKEEIPQWISVKNLLPTNCTNVIVCSKDEIGEAYYEKNRFYSENHEYQNITHWMYFAQKPNFNETL